MGETDILYLTTQGLIDRFLHADNIITLCYVYLHIFLLVHIIHSIIAGLEENDDICSIAAVAL